MGEFSARNVLSWLELLINRYCCIYLVFWYYCISDARSNKHQFQIRELYPQWISVFFYHSKSKQWLFHNTALSDWFLKWKSTVFSLGHEFNFKFNPQVEGGFQRVKGEITLVWKATFAGPDFNTDAGSSLWQRLQNTLTLSQSLGTVDPLYRTGVSLISRESFFIFNQQIYFFIS